MKSHPKGDDDIKFSIDLFHKWIVAIKMKLPSQGWISDMGIDGPTFVPKSGYFLLIWVKVRPQKLAFS